MAIRATALEPEIDPPEEEEEPAEDKGDGLNADDFNLDDLGDMGINLEELNMDDLDV